MRQCATISAPVERSKTGETDVYRQRPSQCKIGRAGRKACQSVAAPACYMEWCRVANDVRKQRAGKSKAESATSLQNQLLVYGACPWPRRNASTEDDLSIPPNNRQCSTQDAPARVQKASQTRPSWHQKACDLDSWHGAPNKSLCQLATFSESSTIGQYRSTPEEAA